MNNIKQYITAGAAAAVMLAASAAIILYSRGVYDFAFAPREKKEQQTAPEAIVVHPLAESADDTIAPPAPDDNVSSLFDPDKISADTSASPEDAVSYPTAAELKEQGYKTAAGSYKRGSSKLGLIESPVVTRTSLHSGGTLTLQTYGGYVIYNNGETRFALGRNGMISVAGITRLQPANLRDSQGHPLWKLKNDGQLYYLVDNSNTMVLSEADPNFAPPMQFDYPLGYGAPQGRLKRYYSVVQVPRKFDAEGNDVTDEVAHILSEAAKNGKDTGDANVYASLGIPEYTVKGVDAVRYGYVNANGAVAVSAQYMFATEFDETGHALVADEHGIVKIIDSYGTARITLNSRTLYPESRNKRPVTENYYLPDSFGLESSGMFAFDHGYIRMRYMQYDYKYETEIVQDYNVLVREDGTLFDIPSGYDLVGYSEGVLLLEREGKYGMLDITGKWIIQPAYASATPFVQGLAVIGNASGRYAMIDTSGNIILPFDYDHISLPSSGVITAHLSSGGWQIFGIMTK